MKKPVNPRIPAHPGIIALAEAIARIAADRDFADMQKGNQQDQPKPTRAEGDDK